MDESDINEALFSLYLRLNGYFSTGFIVHAPEGNTTEIDTLAIRFPFHCEPEREIGTCEFLLPPRDNIDFLICEVKGGKGRPNFNQSLRSNKNAINSVLQRFGAFNKKIIDSASDEIIQKMDPKNIRKSHGIPTITIEETGAQIRLILVWVNGKRNQNVHEPYIYGNEIISYILSCLSPKEKRLNCGTQYNWGLWGEQYKKSLSTSKTNKFKRLHQ